ncbi:MAG: hypothetical protein RMJ98_08800 [Myxococcales bacterium]|nr:hypothetical protein [Polyangiaceae bacterium]MDW8249387.1 hypothetical protein [Myxococcales bacterium]
MNTAQALDTAGIPLDWLRGRLFRWLLSAPVFRWLLCTRDRRLGFHAVLGVAVALGLTAIFPAFLFVVGPLVLGVAHVASDLRYLLLRRSVPRGVTGMAVLFCGALFALRMGELLGQRWLGASQEMMLLEVWAGASVVAAGLAERRKGRAALALGAVLALGAMAQRWPELSRLVFAHGHNLIGVGLWLLLFRRRLGPVVPALILLGAGIVLTGSGATLPLAAGAGGLSFAGQHLVDVATWIAPGVPLRFLAGAVLSYVFLQAVHYSVWLAWIPQEDTRAEGTTSFRMSFRSLRQDLRGLLAPVVALVALVPAAALVFGASLTRDVYLSLASFHGYLEVAMVFYFLVAPGALRRTA